MSIKSSLISLTVITLLAGGGYGGARIGMLYQQRLDQRSAVEADAAHWNPKTADFVWGSAESSNLIALNLDQVMSDRPDENWAPKPGHKPNKGR